MKLDELMLFAPLLPFLGLAAFGVWKQRKNPKLPGAIAGGVIGCAGAISLGTGAVLMGATIAFVGVLVWGAVWTLIRALR